MFMDTSSKMFRLFDTTVSSTLDVTVQWNVINTNDDIYCANFVLQKNILINHTTKGILNETFLG